MASSSVVERLTVNQDAERNRRFESCLASCTLVHLEVDKNKEVSDYGLEMVSTGA